MTTLANVTPMELEMQELEPIEAPGFWTGFQQGLGISFMVVTVAGASAAYAT